MSSRASRIEVGKNPDACNAHVHEELMEEITYGELLPGDLMVEPDYEKRRWLVISTKKQFNRTVKTMYVPITIFSSESIQELEFLSSVYVKIIRNPPCEQGT